MSSPASLLKKVEDELICHICLDTYSEPKLLQCFHVYCKRCLVRLVVGPRGGPFVLRCPECREETQVPNTGVKGLRSAFYINRLLGIVGEPRQEGNLANPRPEHQSSEGQGRKCCSKHAGEELTLYCEACGELICWKCAYEGGEHYNHNHQFIDEAFKKYQEEISSSQKLMMKQMLSITEAMENTKERIVKISEQYESIKADVYHNARKVHLLSQLERLTNIKLDNLSTQQQRLELIQIQLKSCLDFMKNSSSSHDFYEVLEMKTSVVSRINKLTHPLQCLEASGGFDVGYLPEAMHYKVHFPNVDQTQENFRKGLTYPATNETQSYATALLKLPTAFYYNALTGIIITGDIVEQRSFPGSAVPPENPHNMLRHPRHDTFRPPLGQPVYYLTSVGYGKEVGLANGMHKVYDPCSKKKFILDHNTASMLQDVCSEQDQKTTLTVQSVPVDREVSEIPLRAFTDVCTDTFIVKATAERARSKQVSYVLSAKGQNGFPGTDGHMGGADGAYGGDGGKGGNGQNGGNVLVTLNGSAKDLKVTGSKELTVHLGGVSSKYVMVIDCCGGNGGRGGFGGMGGPGGRGGDGGDGGDAGNGGNCVVQTADASLLMLVEVDCMPGDPGSGVQGGEGGVRREGGIHDRLNRLMFPSQNGWSGSRGKDGKYGQTGQTGGVLWVLQSGSEVLRSSTRYDAQVEHLEVVPVLDDGIFEPNERITVFDVLVHNTGGLDLPNGAVVFIPSSNCINFEPFRFTLPALKTGQKYHVPFKFHGRIFDMHPPTQPGPQSLKADFHTQIELLGRPFEKSYFKKEIIAQYPLRLGYLYSPKLMDRGETSLISIEVKNISSAPYGNCKGTGGRVVLHLHLDSRLIPLGKVAADADAPYEVTYNHDLPDSTFVELHNVPPKETFTVNIKVLLEKHAELFDQCNWQVDLCLRDKLIEYNQQSIKVSPIYDPHKSPADVLLVTNKDLSHDAYLFWHNSFDIVGASVDIWDTDRYCGFSVNTQTGARHNNSWYGRYHGKLIICLEYDPKLFDGRDIVQHFHGDFHNKPLKELNSSLILLASQSGSSKMNILSILEHLARVNPMLELSPSVLSTSESPHFINNIERYLRKLEEHNLSQSFVLLKHQPTGRPPNNSSNYFDLHELPILKSSKFLIMDGVKGLKEKSEIASIDIPCRSTFGQALLAMIYGLSVQAKLKLIRKQHSVPNNVVFSLLDGSLMGKEELVMICLAWEVADELFDCSGKASRMRQFYDDVMCNVGAYKKCGRIILRGLKLIEKEFHKRRLAGLKHYKVMQAHGKISEMSKCLEKTLVEFGVNSSKLENMLSLDQLQDSSKVYRCHQHFVKEKKWNLTGIL